MKEEQPKKVQYPPPEICEKCKGTGAVEDKFGFLKMCEKCQGEGILWR